MRRHVSYEMDDETYEKHIKPIVDRKKLSKLISQFLDLYTKSAAVRSYFENVDSISAEKRLKRLEGIIADKSLPFKLGILEAEIDDAEFALQSAKKQGISQSGDDLMFSFEEEEDTTGFEQVEQNYATKEDISRIEDTMAEILRKLNSGVVMQQSQPSGMGQSVAEAQDEVESGEDAGDALAMLDQFF